MWGPVEATRASHKGGGGDSGAGPQGWDTAVDVAADEATEPLPTLRPRSGRGVRRTASVHRLARSSKSGLGKVPRRPAAPHTVR